MRLRGWLWHKIVIDPDPKNVLNKKHIWTYWICGIYKISRTSRGQYQAYFIQEWFENWGDHVSRPPDRVDEHDCWGSLNGAKAACKRHASTYEPSTRIRKRAAEILKDMQKRYA